MLRRILGFDAKGVVSVALWVARRRHGVPAGAVALPYAREQATLLMLFVFLQVVETFAAELLLRAWNVAPGVRGTVLFVDVYSIFVVLAIGAAGATRPHVVTADELRVRYGAFFDLRVPRALISSVRLTRSYDEQGMVRVGDGRLAVAVSSQTNVVVELSEPVTAVRPLGKTAEVTTVRFFTDTPGAALTALSAGASRTGSDGGSRSR
ncbi:hypothetical protein J5X84_25115 [Streptosporangiaceae bacterium NEAU-GS5]|nr:hypothetical protein [Streptosporangiaceae bacterium NEAU-GS5]